jgi:Na+-transporting NADH:ubiquinone oxidoreductase subunit NqrC
LYANVFFLRPVSCMPISFFFVLCLVCQCLFSSSCVLYVNVCFLRPVSCMSMSLFFVLCLVCQFLFSSSCVLFVNIQDTGRRKQTLTYKTQDEE